MPQTKAAASTKLSWRCPNFARGDVVIHAKSSSTTTSALGLPGQAFCNCFVTMMQLFGACNVREQNEIRFLNNTFEGRALLKTAGWVPLAMCFFLENGLFQTFHDLRAEEFAKPIIFKVKCTISSSQTLA